MRAVAPWSGVLVLLGYLAGCDPIPPSGAPLSPVAPRAAAPIDAPAAPIGPQGDFDFDAEDRDPAVDAAPADPAPAPAPVAPLAPPPVFGPGAAAVGALPAFDPGSTRSGPALGDGFGVRVLATLLDVSPPRAVLALPDGDERVVVAGAFLPDQQTVVLAIGADFVEIARFTPAGAYATIQRETVRALYPAPR